MLNKDYDPYDQLQYLTEGMTELAGMIHRQSQQMESLTSALANQTRYCAHLSQRIQQLENTACN